MLFYNSCMWIGKEQGSRQAYINHRLIFEILLNNDCKVEAKKKGLVTVVLPVGSPDLLSECFREYRMPG